MARRSLWKQSKSAPVLEAVEPPALPAPVSALGELRVALGDSAGFDVEKACLAFSYVRVFPNGRSDNEPRALDSAVRATASLLSKAVKPEGFVEPVLSIEELNYLSTIMFRRPVSSQAEYLELCLELVGPDIIGRAGGAEKMLASSRARFDDRFSSAAVGLRETSEYLGVPKALPEFADDCSPVFALAVAASQCDAALSFLSSCEVYPAAAKDQDVQDRAGIMAAFSSAGSLFVRLGEVRDRLTAKLASIEVISKAPGERSLLSTLEQQRDSLVAEVLSHEEAFQKASDSCFLLARGYGELAVSQMVALAKFEEFRAGQEEALVIPSDESDLLADADVSASAAADIASSRGFKF